MKETDSISSIVFRTR